ncbi:MAG: hypothetical protein IKO40_13780, partial [Kiritimatiellae bacterium]|nr:hypothetical protein [Kiritimatiellia bacterium]
MKKKHLPKAPFFAAIAIAVAALPAAASSAPPPPPAGQVAQAPALPIAPLDGLEWRLPPRFATLED